jgi:L-amino acid N-acyltransferase YncA
MKNDLVIRKAQSLDVPAMYAFIFEHGVNPWNYLSHQYIGAHLAEIESGKTQGLLIRLEGEIAGLTTFMSSTEQAHYQAPAYCGSAHGYISEAVVHRERTCCGIGATLLRAAVVELAAQGHKEIYAERHEENKASAGMMRKAGFVEIDVFEDLERRAAGSRRTSVSRLIL